MNFKVSFLKLLLRLTNVYPLYEWYLNNQLDRSKMPKHIGIIVDGNRRWAKHNALTAVDTYRIGADKLERVLDWCIEVGIQAVTVYVLSTENFNRTKEDLDALYEVLEERLERLFHDEKVYRNQIRIKAIGKLEMLPERIMNLINRLEDVTGDYDKHYLNIAVAYGGRAEILESIRSIAGNIARGEIDPNKISCRVQQFMSVISA